MISPKGRSPLKAWRTQIPRFSKSGHHARSGCFAKNATRRTEEKKVRPWNEDRVLGAAGDSRKWVAKHGERALVVGSIVERTRAAFRILGLKLFSGLAN